MKPRVFISSTYYDLKHVRERLERFIQGFYFEPVLFESDNVTFEHGQPLDESCCKEVSHCQMMVLIIGGRYGSAVSGTDIEKKRERYEKEYISITRREFDIARKNNIPVFIFIDKEVYAEYQIYIKNRSLMDSDRISFAHVDNPAIFNFIQSVATMPIKTFERVDEIENYLGNQIAGMFFLYLDNMRKDAKERQILDSVSELKNLSEQMNAMLKAVGRDVLNEDYEKVIKEQNKIIIDYFIDKLDNVIESDGGERIEYTNELVDRLLQFYHNFLFNDEFCQDNIPTEADISAEIAKVDDRLFFNSDYGWFLIRDYQNRIKPILEKDESLQKYFNEALRESVFISTLWD